MKILKTIILLFIASTAFGKVDTTVTKTDTLQVYFVVESVETEKPERVYEGIIIRDIFKGRLRDYQQFKRVGNQYALLPKNDFITPIIK